MEKLARKKCFEKKKCCRNQNNSIAFSLFVIIACKPPKKALFACSIIHELLATAFQKVLFPDDDELSLSTKQSELEPLVIVGKRRAMAVAKLCQVVVNKSHAK